MSFLFFSVRNKLKYSRFIFRYVRCCFFLFSLGYVYKVTRHFFFARSRYGFLIQSNYVVLHSSCILCMHEKTSQSSESFEKHKTKKNRYLLGIFHLEHISGLNMTIRRICHRTGDLQDQSKIIERIHICYPIFAARRRHRFRVFF